MSLSESSGPSTHSSMPIINWDEDSISTDGTNYTTGESESHGGSWVSEYCCSQNKPDATDSCMGPAAFDAVKWFWAQIAQDEQHCHMLSGMLDASYIHEYGEEQVTQVTMFDLEEVE